MTGAQRLLRKRKLSGILLVYNLYRNRNECVVCATCLPKVVGNMIHDLARELGGSDMEGAVSEIKSSVHIRWFKD